jgi:molybdopterin converting factor subunit 1
VGAILHHSQAARVGKRTLYVPLPHRHSDILLLMRIEVLLFATFADVAGCRTVSLEVEESCTVRSMIQALQEKFPALRDYTAARILVAVNQEMAGPEQQLSRGDEVGVFPPVSGG